MDEMKKYLSDSLGDLHYPYYIMEVRMCGDHQFGVCVSYIDL